MNSRCKMCTFRYGDKICQGLESPPLYDNVIIFTIIAEEPEAQGAASFIGGAPLSYRRADPVSTVRHTTLLFSLYEFLKVT
jgi:hypothetical protein